MTFEELKIYDTKHYNIVNQNENDGLVRLIEMAWQDRTPFEAISKEYGISENQIVKNMRKLLKPNSFKRWRKRVQGRKTKHQKKQVKKVTRFQGPW
mgnify:CR=1 FL=1